MPLALLAAYILGASSLNVCGHARCFLDCPCQVAAVACPPSLVRAPSYAHGTFRASSNASLLRTWELSSVVLSSQTFQNPPDCSRSSVLLFGYSTSLGFGAVAKHFAVGMHHAIRTARIFIMDESSSFYWTQGCADENYQVDISVTSSRCPPRAVIRLSAVWWITKTSQNWFWIKSRTLIPVRSKFQR